MAAPEAATSSFTLLIDSPKWQLLVTGLCLAAALLIGAVVLALVKRWWRRNSSEEDLSPSAQLAHFRSLYESGTISAEEYERLRSVLTGRLREGLGVPAPVKPPPPPSEPPSDNPETGIRPPPG